MRQRDIDLGALLVGSIRPVVYIRKFHVEGMCGETNSFLMLSERGMNYTTVEQNLGSIRDPIELLQGLIKLIVVIVGKCCHPSLDFLVCEYQYRSLQHLLLG